MSLQGDLFILLNNHSVAECHKSGDARKGNNNSYVYGKRLLYLVNGAKGYKGKYYAACNKKADRIYNKLYYTEAVSCFFHNFSKKIPAEPCKAII